MQVRRALGAGRTVQSKTSALPSEPLPVDLLATSLSHGPLRLMSSCWTQLFKSWDLWVRGLQRQDRSCVRDPLTPMDPSPRIIDQGEGKGGPPCLLLIPTSKHFPGSVSWAMSFISLGLDGFPTFELASPVFAIMSSYLYF